MKTKIAMLILGLFAWSLNAPAQETGSAPADAATNAPAAEAVTNAPAADAVTNAPAATAESATAAAVTNAPAEQTETTPAATPVAAANSGAVIPLIVMDDVPLTDAIKNLARQAGINYMLDPKIAYGQPGPDGKIIPQPSVSIRWENITAAQALNALLSNYSLQLVENPKTGIAQVTHINPAAAPPLLTKIIQLQYASPSNIVTAVKSIFTDPRSKVVPDIRTSRLVVVATEKEMDAIDQMVTNLDTPTKQVLIEAKLYETSMSPKTVKGIDWSQTAGAQHVSFGNGVMSGNWNTAIPGAATTRTLPGGRTITTSSSTSQSGSLLNTLGAGGFSLNTLSGLTPNVGFLNADGVKAVLSFLNSDSQAKVLSEPRTITLDNETAHIEVGQDYPIINVTAGTANTTGGSQITYSNLSVSLDVTPRISANDLINLRVNPHVLRLDHVQTFTVGGQPFDVPIFDTRTIETTVMIPSGNTLVMGGLVQDNTTINTTKVPLLGDIPFLGAAFRSKEKDRSRNNLMVFITPTIVKDSDFQPTTTDFMKTALPKEDSEEWSYWDSTKPYDWSKPQQSGPAPKFDDSLVQPAPAPVSEPQQSDSKPKFDDSLVQPQPASANNP